MKISEVIAAIGGQTVVPHQPDGDPNHQPLSPLGLDKTVAEPFPANVEAQQGAGGGYLHPGAQGQAADGTVEPGNVHGYSQGGPALLPPSQGVEALTPGPPSQPLGGAVPYAAPVGRPDHALGRDSSESQLLNPAFKPAKAPSGGIFGRPGL